MLVSSHGVFFVSNNLLHFTLASNPCLVRLLDIVSSPSWSPCPCKLLATTALVPISGVFRSLTIKRSSCTSKSEGLPNLGKSPSGPWSLYRFTICSHSALWNRRHLWYRAKTHPCILESDHLWSHVKTSTSHLRQRALPTIQTYTTQIHTKIVDIVLSNSLSTTQCKPIKEVAHLTTWSFYICQA